MLEGTTKSGFNFKVADESLNDFELIEVLSEVDVNPLLLPRLVNMLLGDEQKKALMDHLRTEKGNVPLDAMSDEIMEIFQTGSLKNS